MARYEITSPDGKRYEINAPEGATQEQVLSYAQSQFSQQAPKAGPPRSLEESIRRDAHGSEELTGNYYLDRMKSGGMNVLRGAAAGGLPGVIAAGGKEALQTVTDVMDRGAYKAGGAVTDAASAMGMPPEVAAGAGFAANVGVQAIPAIIGAVAGEAARPVLQAGGRRLMQSALKPSPTDMVSGKAAQTVQTMLDEGANVTAGGAAKLRTAIDALKAEIAGQVAQSPAMIGKQQPAREVMQLLDKMKSQANPGPDQAAILKVWDEFNKTFASQIPIAEAQAVKQGTYRVLGERAYARAAENPAAVDAQKAIARGLRKAIEQELPQIAKLNQKEKNLISAFEAAEWRAAQAGNVNPAGLAYLSSNPKAAAGFLADRSPLFKSLFARLLHNAAAPASVPLGAGFGALMGAEGAQE